MIIIFGLIQNCAERTVFVPFILPFADGNGRMGRLWHTLLLSKWNTIFAWLPIESMIHDHQEEYYNAINSSNASGESTQFIEFMLFVIKAALAEASEVNDVNNNHKSRNDLRWDMIKNYLINYSNIMNSDVQKMFGVSSATANRILKKLEKEDKLKRMRLGSYWGYMLVE